MKRKYGCNGEIQRCRPAVTLPRLLRPSRRRGFTIIEMIVATILLAVGASAALYTISLSTRNTGLAAERSIAATLAQQRIAEIEAQPDQITGGTQTGAFGDQYPQFSWEETVDTTDFPTLMRVTLVVSWQAGSMKRSVQFVTYESNVSTPPPSSGTTGTGGAAGSGTGTGG